MRILIVASDPMEFPGIVSRSANVRPAQVAVDWSRYADLNGNQLLLVANGVGARRASAAVDAAFPALPPDAIVSTGFCGALDESLATGDIITADCVQAGPNRWPVVKPASTPVCRTGTVISIDRVAQTAAEKRRLHDAGGIGVEMEAGAVAKRAAELAIPFYCIRVVTDLAGEDMANDFNKALRDDGHFATIRILTGTLRRPLVRLPELLRLRTRCVQAARVLGDFIADCRF